MPLASNQVQYSLTYRAPERNGVLAACQELGVTLIAYSPMAQGLLTGAQPCLILGVIILPAILLGRCGGVTECGQIVRMLHVAWWCMQSN